MENPDTTCSSRTQCNAKEGPVHGNGMERVNTMGGRRMDQMLEHSIVDDLVSVGDKFPLLNGVCHEGDIVDRSTLWIGEVLILVYLEGTGNIAHDDSITKLEPLDVFSLDEGHCMACNDVVSRL